MNKFLIILCLLCSFQITHAQQLMLNMGKTISTFDYKNSDGNKLDNLLSRSYGYMEAGYKLPVFTENFKVLANVTYNKYGASGSERSYYFEWDMAYLGGNVGLEYDLWRIGDFFNRKNGFVKGREGLIFFIKGTFSGEFLITGTQQINNQAYNLKGVEQFDQPLFFVRGGAGLSYGFSEDVALFFQYMGGKSFPLLKGNPDDKEELSLITHQFGFGVLIKILHK
ncbi:hypothetical protein [Flexithrix dorotheae]|uniref:hypothetical protein n=1 Tax=Flexithrix dorotheae TaxID=70993 RepID=UPI0012FAE6A5|nr:hypothetical protein [Flexithrix dorotheae]